MANEKLGTIIHGIGAHESLDSSGERIEIKGIDISSLTQDGVINTEHKSEATSQIIGKIIEATKILKKEDCKNKHHEHFWEKGGKMPYLYIKAVLFDQFGHTGAQDAVAMLKFDKAMQKDETKQLAGFSVEGSKLDKSGALIKRCIARKISWTLTPCNKACVAEILEPESEESPKSITLADLKIAFKKAEEMEIELAKNEKKYMTSLAGKLTPRQPSKKQTYSKITPATGEHRPGSEWKPKQTIPNSQAPTKAPVGTRIEYKKPKARTGAEIYRDPETWKTESNVRKKIVKKSVKKSMTSPTTKTKIHMSEKDMAKAKKEILKNMSEEAFELFKNKELLIDIAKSKMPEASEEEILAFAKTYAYVQMKKSEMELEKEVEKLEKKDRCWDGFEPTPGKKAYSKGSCRPIKKSKTEKESIKDLETDLKKKPLKKFGGRTAPNTPIPSTPAPGTSIASQIGFGKKEKVADNEIVLRKFEDGTAEIVWGKNVKQSQVDKIIKKELMEYDEVTESIEKKEKPFHGYNPNKHSKEGGLSDKAREKYNRETGSDLKRPVTGKVKPGSEAAKRRKSFCARMSGVKGPTSKEGKLTPKGAALKRWKC